MSNTKPQVLLVDDDPAVRRSLAPVLEAAGYEVRLAADGDEALKLLDALCPHFLIVDSELPGVDGFELCRRIRQQELPNYVYALCLCGGAQPNWSLRALEAGADAVLPKPCDHAELLARLSAGQRVLDLERRLSEVARTDLLTGIPTRRAFYEQFDREMHRALRYRLPLSCIMVDVDYFKKINDVHGHPAGDAVLKVVAGLLQNSIRASDYVCRYGGEEFCVLLTETSDTAAAVWAERVRKKLAEMRIDTGDGAVNITASFGVAELLEDTKSATQLVDLADQALLVAKQSGRDRVVKFRTLYDSAALSFTSTGLGDPFANIVARNVMTTLVSCLEQNETVGRAAEFFLRFRINSSPVVDSYGKLVGILSEKDVMGVMMTADSWNKPLREVMKTSVVCYQEDTPIKTIYDFLCRVTIRRVIIVKDGYPTGIISRGALLRWFNNWLIVQGHKTESPKQNGFTDSQRRRLALVQTSQSLCELASRLYAELTVEDEDFLPALIDSSSRMQELINDMLSDSRSFVECPETRTAPPRCGSAYDPEFPGLATGMGAMAALAALEDRTATGS